MGISISNPSYDKVYTAYAWRYNSIFLNMTQGEGIEDTGVVWNDDGTIDQQATSQLSVTADHVKVPRFQLRDDRGIIDLTDCQVVLAVKRPKGAEDLLACYTVGNASDGTIACPITRSVTAIEGRGLGEIRVLSQNAVIKFYGIHFNIYKGVSDLAAEQSTQFAALVSALQKVALVNPDGSNTVDMDSEITANGTNPVASGLIYNFVLSVLDNTTKVSYETDVPVDSATGTGTIYHASVGGSKALIIPVSSDTSQVQFRLDRDGKIYVRRREIQGGSFPNWGAFVDITSSDFAIGILQTAIDAGGNLINKFYLVDGFLGTDGEIKPPTNGQKTTDFIPCQAGDKFISSVMTQGEQWQCYVIYNSNKEKVGDRVPNGYARRYYDNAIELRQEVTISDSNAAYIRFSNGGGTKLGFEVYKCTKDNPKLIVEDLKLTTVAYAKETGGNLVDLVGTTNGFVSAQGVERAPSSGHSEKVTEFIPVSYGETYRARVAAASTNFCIMFYNSDKQFINRVVSVLSDYNFSIDNQNAAYMRISTWQNNYFEVKLVSTVNANAKNVLENVAITGGYISSNGGISDPSPTTKEIVSDFIFIKGDDSIHFHIEVNAENDPWMAMAFYNENKTFIGERLANNKGNLLLNNRRFLDMIATVPDNASFVRVSCRTYDNATYSAYVGSKGLVLDVFNNHLETALSTIRNLDIEGNCNAVNHKGFSLVAPENTLPAFLLSKKMGFSKVECDVALTADYVPVLLHNDTIDATSNGKGRIDKLTWDQVKDLDFGSWKSSAYAGTHIPKFEEFMELCHDVGLHPYIELKNSATFAQEDIDEIVSIVNKKGMRGKCTYISISDTYLSYVKNADSEARLGYVVPVVNSAVITQCQNLQTSENEVFVDCNYVGLTDEHVEICAIHNIPIEVWTVNDISTIRGLSPYVTGVTSDWLNVNVVRHDKWN